MAQGIDMTTELQTDASISKTNVDTINIGKRLKVKRTELGFDERHVATELKIPIDQVRALEANNFKYFRSVTFARGFLKSYCRLLGIEHSEMLRAFDNDLEDTGPTIKPVDKVNKQTHLGDPIVIFISVVIVAVLVFLVFWWPSKSTTVAAEEQKIEASEKVTTLEPKLDSESEAVINELPLSSSDAISDAVDMDTDLVMNNGEVETASPEETQDTVKVATKSNVATGLSAETMAILEEAGVSPDEVVRATADASSQPASQVPTYTDEVEMTFDADCWTEVRDSTGKILFSGVKSAGSSLSLTGKAPYRVVLGYAKGVSSLEYKGEAFDFSSFIRNDLARFELK
jgi:cytoskeleton protein RodZ